MLIKDKNMNTKDYIINRIKLFFRPLISIWYFLKMVSNGKVIDTLKVLDNVKIITNVDGDVYLEFKNSLVINSLGHQVYYSKDGTIITAAKWTSENPDIEVGDYLKDLNNIPLLIKEDERLILEYMNKELLKNNTINFEKFTFSTKRIRDEFNDRVQR